MPVRMVDGEALWTSSKLKKVQPATYRLHYANWLPLAEANGVFEVDFDIVRARVYPIIDPQLTVEDVENIFNEFVRVGLLVAFGAADKDYAYFAGINKPGRLPTEKHLKRYKKLPPNPPSYVLEKETRRVYFAQCEDTRRIKIGSSVDPPRRVEGLRSGNSSQLVLLGTMPGGFSDEHELHAKFSEYRIQGEWFEPAEELLEFIRNNSIPDNPGQRRTTPQGFGLDWSGMDRVGKGLDSPTALTNYADKVS